MYGAGRGDVGGEGRLAEPGGGGAVKGMGLLLEVIKQNVLKSIVVMIVHHREGTKNHCILHFKCINCISIKINVNYLLIKPLPKKIENKQSEEEHVENLTQTFH